MSLTVTLIEFQVPKAKSNLIGCVEYRGVSHITCELNSKTTNIKVNQSFIWPLARAADVEEPLIIQLRSQTTKTLIRTGLNQAAGNLLSSSTTGYISSNSKCIGQYILLMQALMHSGGFIHIEDYLLDLTTNRPLQIAVIFEVKYISPDDEAGNFQPMNLMYSIQQQSYSDNRNHNQKDDQQILEDIAQNIANLERNLNNDEMEGRTIDSLRRQRSRWQQLPPNNSWQEENLNLAATTSAQSHKRDEFVVGTAESERVSSEADDTSPGGSPLINSRDKRLSLKTMGYIMRLGRNRHYSKTRDSSYAENEIRSQLVPDKAGNQTPAPVVTSNAPITDSIPLKRMPGHSKRQDTIFTSDTESKPSSEDDNYDDGNHVGSIPLKKGKILKEMIRTAEHLKSQDFQVCITIIEARQLPGLNMDPVVCIQVGDHKKYTSVKESTNCPYYNEYFVFDFHMPPILLLDKIIILSVLQSRGVLKTNKLIGSFKLDIATVWHQEDHQFYHKWALLTDPDDFYSGPKGYLKCDIGIIGKGDTVKVPTISEKDPDDIEANLLLPDGVPTERQRSRFIIKIYRADGLPRMNSSLMANVKRALTGEFKDLVSPYVQVSFAGLTGKTSIKKHAYAPVWNEQLVFNEMFPPLCQRIKIQLKDADPMKPTIIGTHYIDLRKISNDGERGFLPTFGPSFIHFYGSTRDYTLLNHHSNLNDGLGEGVSYRARLLLAIRTEIVDGIELVNEKNVEIGPTIPIAEGAYYRNEEFFLFASIMEASMIDRKIADKNIYFELSMGNAGNCMDGHNESFTNSTDDSEESNCLLETVDTTSFSSTTSACRATTHDKSHYYLPYWDYKPCMDVRCTLPDTRRRMYNTNILFKMAEKLEDGLAETKCLIDNEDIKAEVSLRLILEDLASACIRYQAIHKSNATELNNCKTKLDRERLKVCQTEIENLENLARNLRALVTRNSLQARYKQAQNILQKLKFLIDDPQHSLPDVFVWLIANGKRYAYHRLPARELVYSSNEEECGIYNGKTQTVLLKLPGLCTGPTGWSIQAKLSIYMWLGVVGQKGHFCDGLPSGYDISHEIRNAERPGALAPNNIHYLKKSTYQLRANIYQARSLIGSDASGLSDPYAVVYITEFAKSTQVIEETLSPTWDELLLFEEILLFGTKEEIKKNPPAIIIEIYDQDKVGKSEFIGRAVAKPKVKLRENAYTTPTLEWFSIFRGSENAGELLAALEMLELGASDLPKLTEPKESVMDSPQNKSSVKIPSLDVVYPVPQELKPQMSTFRIEVLFWGLRDIKRVHFMSVEKPRIDVECSGRILSSTIIQNAKRNPNFPNMLKSMELELPVEEIYAPPFTIRCVDCRSFGRYTLVGTHQISSVHRYLYKPPIKEDNKNSKISAQVILSSPLANHKKINGSIDLSQNSFRVEQSSFYGTAAANQLGKKLSFSKSASIKNSNYINSTMQDHNSQIELNRDWWTKYFWSYEQLINKAKVEKILNPKEKYLNSPYKQYLSPNAQHSNLRSWKLLKKLTLFGRQQNELAIPYDSAVTTKAVTQQNVALCHIYPYELETHAEFNCFREWLHSFSLYRGKKTEESADDENRIVGIFKGGITIYKLPCPKGVEYSTPNYPANDPIHVLVRVYIIKATDLHPMDLNGKADPYVVLHFGNKRISDKENYISKQLNPVFGKCYEVEATFPQESMLTLQIFDWDLVGSDDLIGETRIDLENRFYSRHRATCGLALYYDETGYNKWRDPMKPTQILAKLCKDNKLETPHYFQHRVAIGKYCMTFTDEEVLAWNGPTTCRNRDEHLALAVLHRWSEIPKIGCKLVEEHIECRSLYNPDKIGIEQGKVEMWIDMFPMDMPLPGPPVDISPRKPTSYELRVIIWNTDDVLLEDDAFFTGEKMSDIYVKGWLKGPQDVQSTDIHYRSLTGEGNFNWRFMFPFEYLAAEERIVLSRKESVFSWDETEVKIPARLELQVWDADHFSADDFLGAISFNLNRFPRGAKNSKLCTLDMLKSENVPSISIFKQKRVRGWWPFYVKKQNEEMELTGKVEAELHLLTSEEAEQNPAGYGRNEPDALEKPSRPEASFIWFINPLKTIRYILWHNYKWTILKILLFTGILLFLMLIVYSVPGYSVKKLLSA